MWINKKRGLKKLRCTGRYIKRGKGKKRRFRLEDKERGYTNEFSHPNVAKREKWERVK